MGTDIKKLRTRIKSVNSTLHLTKAMGLVASSKIRRATEKMNNSREYLKAVEESVAYLSSNRECLKSPYLANRKGKNIQLICIAGDRGLAGGYNANIFRLAREYDGASITAIGKYAADKFGGDFRSVEAFSYEDAKILSEKLCKDFAEEKFDRLGIICTNYISMMSQQPCVKWILPLEKSDEKTNIGIVFEPDELTALNSIIPEYVAGAIFSAARESFACEVVSRRVAMDAAGKNAQEMLDGLGLEYNRARQGAITQEITEIVAGSGL